MRIYAALRRFWRADDGATLVEFGLVVSLFFLMFFAMIDFGRMGFHYVAAEKAVGVAARVAAVRPPACTGVPQLNERLSGTTERFGSSCSAGGGICVNPGTISCTGNLSNATVAEIWPLIQGALPISATAANLRFRYSYDENLGFLGGPYVPVVTVELQDLDFTFISPLVGSAVGAVASGSGANIRFPPLSVSLPGEDLALGESG